MQQHVLPAVLQKDCLVNILHFVTEYKLLLPVFHHGKIVAGLSGKQRDQRIPAINHTALLRRNQGVFPLSGLITGINQQRLAMKELIHDPQKPQIGLLQHTGNTAAHIQRPQRMLCAIVHRVPIR